MLSRIQCRVAGFAILAVLTTTLGVDGAAHASTAGSSVLSACLAATAHQKSVHTVSVSSGAPVSSTGSSIAKVALITDAGGSEGAQTVTFTQGGRVGHESIRLVDGVAYSQGDEFTLQNFNGFPPAKAVTYQDRWIAVPKSNAAFAPISSSLTMSSVVSQLQMKSASMLTRTRVNGLEVNRLSVKITQGTLTGTIVLACRASSNPLPVQQSSLTTSGSDHSLVTFSRWNEAIHVMAPSNSIPISVTGL
jgi:hypothetical protein